MALQSNPLLYVHGELYAGDWHLASYVQGTTEFLHADWLGTVRVRTSRSGAVVNSYTSLPFGDCLAHG